MTSSKVLVLGASGFLGANLVRVFWETSGISVVGASRSHSLPNMHWLPDYSGDTLQTVLDSVQPSHIVNCVGIVGHHQVDSNSALANSLNIALPARLAEFASERNIGLVHFSTDSVYSGNPSDAPFTEASKPAPFSLYGQQKLESERVVAQTHPASLILRVNFFGWSISGKRGMLDYFVSHGLAGTRPLGYRDYMVTSIHASFLARVTAQAIENGLSGLFNLGSPDGISKLNFGQEVFSSLGLAKHLVEPANPSIWLSEGVHARDLSMDSSKIETALGIAIPIQPEGIRHEFSQFAEFRAFYHLPLGDLRSKIEDSREWR